MQRRIVRVLAAGWALWTGICPVLLAADEGRHQVRFVGTEWRRPHRRGESLRVGWVFEGEGRLESPLCRVSFSRDGGASWTELYQGTDTSFLWEIVGEPDTDAAALKVELLNDKGEVLSADLGKGLVIDSTVPQIAAQSAESSTRREVPIRARVDRAGPSGVALMQVWVTSDGGKRWEYAGSQREMDAPFILRRPRGKWGVTLTAVSNARVVEPHPRAGDAPEITVDIEPEEPVVSLKVDPMRRFYQGGETLRLEWSVLDEDLPERAVAVEYRKSDGQWVSLLEGQERQGEHAWTLPQASLGVSELRVRAKDAKGNEGQRSILLAAWVDADPPRGQVLGPAVFDRAGPVEVQYQLNEIGSGLDSAAIHYRERPEEDWRVFAYLTSTGSIARRELSDGTYFLALTASDRAKNRMPETFETPFRMIVDRIAPVLKVEEASARLDGVRLKWRGIDANLGPTPVRILYRWDDGSDWKPLRSDLAGEGEEVFPVPEGGKEGSSLTLRIHCRDLSGKEASETAVVKIGGVLPKIHLKQAQFVQTGRLLVEWEASGEAISDQPVVVEASTVDGTVFFKQSALPAAGSVEIEIPKASQGKDLSVVVRCVNRWAGEASERSTLRVAGGGPRVRIHEAVISGGKLRVDWEAQGDGLPDSPVSIQHEEEGGKIAKIWKDLPRIGSLSWDLPDSFRGTVRVRATCTDRQGRSDSASVLALMSGGTDAIRILDVFQRERHLTVSWTAAAPKMGENPVSIEAKPEKGEWAPVRGGLAAKGTLDWDVPAEMGPRLRLRVACLSDGKTLHSDERLVDLSGRGRPPRGGVEARAVWRGGKRPAHDVPRTDLVPPEDPLAPARALLAEGEGEEAARTLRLYLSGHPDSLDAYLLLIRAHRLQGTATGELIELYRKALALSPRNADLLNEMGVHYLLEEKDPRRALEYFQEALQTSHTAVTYYNVGRAQFQLREYAMAADAFSKAAEVDADFTNALFYLAQIYTQTHLKDRAKAVSLWRRVRDASAANDDLWRRANSELSRLGVR